MDKATSFVAFLIIDDMVRIANIVRLVSVEFTSERRLTSFSPETTDLIKSWITRLKRMECVIKGFVEQFPNDKYKFHHVYHSDDISMEEELEKMMEIVVKAQKEMLKAPTGIDEEDEELTESDLLSCSDLFDSPLKRMLQEHDELDPNLVREWSCTINKDDRPRWGTISLIENAVLVVPTETLETDPEEEFCGYDLSSSDDEDEP